MKRVLQLPASTPSDAIQYEFGINDLSLDILLEKIIVAIDVINKDDDRIAKKLLTELLPKNVKGFCSELNETCSLLNVSLESYVGEPDVRKKLKDKLVEIQAIELFQRMALSSKMDRVLLSGFKYDGSAKKYLMELDFVHAREQCSWYVTGCCLRNATFRVDGKEKGVMCVGLKIRIVTYSHVLGMLISFVMTYGTRCSGTRKY